MSRVGRAVEKGETQGFMKAVVDATSRKILGAAILGTGGDEAIHGILDIMNADVALRRPAARRADPPDGFRADPDAARRSQACRLTRLVELSSSVTVDRSLDSDLAWTLVSRQANSRSSSVCNRASSSATVDRALDETIVRARPPNIPPKMSTRERFM